VNWYLHDWIWNLVDYTIGHPWLVGVVASVVSALVCAVGVMLIGWWHRNDPPETFVGYTPRDLDIEAELERERQGRKK
jgi:hypothetical protein